ncbi:MAG: hypothetical protein ACKPKO_08875, partial [Candidatus Fonsibacter sp.]
MPEATLRGTVADDSQVVPTDARCAGAALRPAKQKDGETRAPGFGGLRGDTDRHGHDRLGLEGRRAQYRVGTPKRGTRTNHTHAADVADATVKRN